MRVRLCTAATEVFFDGGRARRRRLFVPRGWAGPVTLVFASFGDPFFIVDMVRGTLTPLAPARCCAAGPGRTVRPGPCSAPMTGGFAEDAAPPGSSLSSDTYPMWWVRKY